MEAGSESVPFQQSGAGHLRVVAIRYEMVVRVAVSIASGIPLEREIAAKTERTHPVIGEHCDASGTDRILTGIIHPVLQDFREEGVPFRRTEPFGVLYVEDPYDGKLLDALDKPIIATFVELPSPGILEDGQSGSTVGTDVWFISCPGMATLHTGVPA